VNYFLFRNNGGLYFSSQPSYVFFQAKWLELMNHGSFSFLAVYPPAFVVLKIMSQVFLPLKAI